MLIIYDFLKCFSRVRCTRHVGMCVFGLGKGPGVFDVCIRVNV
jgi:hypothetical protein